MTEDEQELLRLINADDPDEVILAHYRKAKEQSWKEGWEDNERNQKG